MENASKALIIAGAILLSILLISLGIMIFNQANGVINSNSMSEVEIQQFNQQFTQYQGERVRGATVNAMLQKVVANNVSQDDASRQVKVVLGTDTIIDIDGASGSSKTTTPPTEKIKTSATYGVTLSYGTGGARAGLVETITVTQK